MTYTIYLNTIQTLIWPFVKYCSGHACWQLCMTLPTNTSAICTVHFRSRMFATLYCIANHTSVICIVQHMTSKDNLLMTIRPHSFLLSSTSQGIQRLRDWHLCLSFVLSLSIFPPLLAFPTFFLFPPSIPFLSLSPSLLYFLLFFVLLSHSIFSLSLSLSPFYLSSPPPSPSHLLLLLPDYKC